MKDVISMKNFTKNLNDFTFTDYYYRLMLIARSVFEWTNLPNGMDEKWIERFLFNDGKCVFFKDKEKGFMIAKCADGGKLNAYDEPTQVRPYSTGYNGGNLTCNEECVIIRNNDIMLPTSQTIQLFAYRLAEITRTIDVNISAQKTPVIVLCSDKQKLSMKRAFDKIEDNEVKIFGDKSLEIENIKALRIDAPIVFDKLQLQKHAIWNECMTYLGINNANQDKRERLVDDEVQANNEQVGASENVFLKARKQACKTINELFELEIDVKVREMQTPKLADSDEPFERGVDND